MIWDKIFTTENLMKIGIGGLLAFVLWAGYSGVWVWGSDNKSMRSAYEQRIAELVAERNEWKQISLDSLKLSKEISPVKFPIMSSGKPQELTPENVKTQLEILKRLNED